MRFVKGIIKKIVNNLIIRRVIVGVIIILIVLGINLCKNFFKNESNYIVIKILIILFCLVVRGWLVKIFIIGNFFVIFVKRVIFLIILFRVGVVLNFFVVLIFI